MAVENEDLFVLQKSGGGELRKASVAALLADAVTPILPVVPDVPEKIGDLDDVSDVVPNNDQILRWNGGQWVPSNEAGQNLDNYLQKPGSEGSFVINEAADGTITYAEAIDGGEYAV